MRAHHRRAQMAPHVRLRPRGTRARARRDSRERTA